MDAGIAERPLRPEQIEVVEDEQAQVLRQKTPGERVEIVGSMWRFARLWIEGGVRSLNPGWDESQVQTEVRRRLSGGAA